MIAQLVNYNLKDFPRDEYQRACTEDLAAPIAAQHGLISKTWIANHETNTYGGFYVWESQADIEAFAKSDLFIAFSSDPRVQNITSTVFEILEEASRTTNGIGVVAV
ncbi:MAG: hypothetical protein HOH95_09040 [Dehalococcoidia bacterium]|jgi:hypothetical protein|nr:hypothetical protein [Dehalococcoidia bacterium]